MKGTSVRLVVAAGIFTLASGVGVATALPAQAQTAVADWNFDETGSPPPVLTDDSGTVLPTMTPRSAGSPETVRRSASTAPGSSMYPTHPA